MFRFANYFCLYIFIYLYVLISKVHFFPLNLKLVGERRSFLEKRGIKLVRC